ncbi:Protein of unknown function [Gryllus bimaculatus]|nr:Protein of unknown function [Gryllus bimaculatus]
MTPENGRHVVQRGGRCVEDSRTRGGEKSKFYNDIREGPGKSLVCSVYYIIVCMYSVSCMYCVYYVYVYYYPTVVFLENCEIHPFISEHFLNNEKVVFNIIYKWDEIDVLNTSGPAFSVACREETDALEALKLLKQNLPNKRKYIQCITVLKYSYIFDNNLNVIKIKIEVCSGAYFVNERISRN